MEIDKNLLVTIPAGEIVLRDDRIKKEWTVKIDTFLIARYPVTQDLYSSITKESPSFFKGDKNPVEQVTWKDAITFCNLLSRKSGLTECYLIGDDILFDLKANGYRLPLEAEWEYACKAGRPEARYGDLDGIAWYKGNSQSSTHEVGTKNSNAWGLYDMLGNVWEWCSDIYDEEVYGSYRIFRGGAGVMRREDVWQPTADAVTRPRSKLMTLASGLPDLYDSYPSL